MINKGGVDVIIGNDVDIDLRVTIVTGTHKLHVLPGKAAGPSYSKHIRIEDGVWRCHG